MKFTDIHDNVLYGYVLNDDYNNYYGSYHKELIIDDVMLLRDVMAHADEGETILFDFAIEIEKGITINDNYYSHEEFMRIINKKEGSDE